MNPRWLADPAKVPDGNKRAAALARQAELTKPPGALGALEGLAVRLAALQGTERPRLERVCITVFAADHGVAQEGVSAFPQAVTVEMVRNFARGGAAVSVLAHALGARLEVVNVGTTADPGPLPGVIDRRIAPGTANIRRAPAMTEAQLADALDAGAEAADRASKQSVGKAGYTVPSPLEGEGQGEGEFQETAKGGAQLFIGGEMGIANTTSATAVAAALLGLPGAALAGPGTGLDEAGVRRKAAIIDEALALHRVTSGDSLGALRCLGGFEIAALAGAYVRCAQLGIPVLVDGFISGVAALCALRLRPDAAPWFFYGHNSAEPGHKRVIEALGAQPLLHLGMRLGEGSGAAAAVPLMRLACALHNEMATFAEAGVSEKSPKDLGTADARRDRRR